MQKQRLYQVSKKAVVKAVANKEAEGVSQSAETEPPYKALKGGLTPQNILLLQRTVGNQAVMRLLSNHTTRPELIQRMFHVPTPIPTTPPAPIISAIPGGAATEEEGPCGNFQRVKTWNIANPVQGIIIQHVTRTFDVKYAAISGQLNGAALDTYVNNPHSTVNATETSYWEAWEVDALGNVSDGGDDTFGLCSLIPGGRKFKNTTKGKVTMVGVAKFYPTANDPTTYGFARNAVTTAGGLFSTTNDPTALLPPAVGPTLTHKVKVTWDSTYHTRNKKNISKNPRPLGTRAGQNNSQYQPYSKVVSTIV